MGNQNTRIDAGVPQISLDRNSPYQPQMNVDTSNQYAMNIHYSAQNEITNPYHQSQFGQQVPNIQQQQQQINPYTSNLPIQQGIPVIQTFEIAQIPQQPITDDLKDQSFQIKKLEIQKALMIYLIMQFLTLGILRLNFNLVESKSFQDVSLPICIISGIGYLLVVILGKSQKFQQNSYAMLNSFLIVILQSLTLISYFSYGVSLKNNIESQFIKILCALLIVQYVINCFVIIITILYLYIEKNHIRCLCKCYLDDLEYLAMLFLASLVCIMIVREYIYFIFATFLYGLILIFVIQQLMNGRFHLKKNKTFGICNAIYLGIMIPCDIF